MFKIIKKEKYEEMQNKLEEKNKQIEDLEAQVFSLKNQLDNVKELNKKYQEREQSLDRELSGMMRNQNQLIEWIERIIHETGAYQVSNPQTIHIPIYEKMNVVPFDKGSIDGRPPQVQREIIIPEIRIIKLG